MNDNRRHVERPCVVTDNGIEYPGVASALIPDGVDFESLDYYNVTFQKDNMPSFLQQPPKGYSGVTIPGVPRTIIRFD